jgi:two-component system chemotaxis response regulator CheY
VLVVDDSSVARLVVERTLLQAGFEIAEFLQASNGLEALHMVRARGKECAKLNLILSDINMPKLDGLGLVEQLRAEGLMRDVPVVMITTEGSEQNVRRALAAGVAGYIRKPFTAEQVRSLVERLVKGADSASC